MISIFVELLIAVFAVWVTWRLIRNFLKPRAPTEPADEPLSLVGAPVKRGPKGRAGAIALDEPDEDEPADYVPPPSF